MLKRQRQKKNFCSKFSMSDDVTPKKIKVATIAVKITPIKITKNTPTKPPRRNAGKINSE